MQEVINKLSWADIALVGVVIYFFMTTSLAALERHKSDKSELNNNIVNLTNEMKTINANMVEWNNSIVNLERSIISSINGKNRFKDDHVEN